MSVYNFYHDPDECSFSVTCYTYKDQETFLLYRKDVTSWYSEKMRGEPKKLSVKYDRFEAHWCLMSLRGCVDRVHAENSGIDLRELDAPREISLYLDGSFIILPKHVRIKQIGICTDSFVFVCSVESLLSLSQLTYFYLGTRLPSLTVVWYGQRTPKISLVGYDGFVHMLKRKLRHMRIDGKLYARGIPSTVDPYKEAYRAITRRSIQFSGYVPVTLHKSTSRRKK